jgi:hypothetical protein
MLKDCSCCWLWHPSSNSYPHLVLCRESNHGNDGASFAMQYGIVRQILGTPENAEEFDNVRAVLKELQDGENTHARLKEALFERA